MANEELRLRIGQVLAPLAFWFGSSFGTHMLLTGARWFNFMTRWWQYLLGDILGGFISLMLFCLILARGFIRL